MAESRAPPPTRPQTQGNPGHFTQNNFEKKNVYDDFDQNHCFDSLVI